MNEIEIIYVGAGLKDIKHMKHLNQQHDISRKAAMFLNFKEEPSFIVEEYSTIFSHGQPLVMQASVSNLLWLNVINVFLAIIYPL